MKTVFDFIKIAKEELKSLYTEQEIQQLIFLLLEEVKGFTRTDMQRRKVEVLDPNDFVKLEKYLGELKNHRPIQYVIGHAWFCGLKLMVIENVLIPRPETEELCEWILAQSGSIQDSHHNSQYSILDIGTGSGCIAIALKQKLPSASVHAIDISEGALEVAMQNAKLNDEEIIFQKGDILSEAFRQSVTETFDIVVSNPPYVRKSEMQKVPSQVKDFEPHTALFVGDDDPLVFYHAIAEFATTHLKNNGQLFFEINEGLGEEVKTLLVEMDFRNVVLKKDISGKERMISAGR